jgi:hypothetical protein
MYKFNSFDYLKYILNNDFDMGYDLYKKCVSHINKELEDKIWDLYLIEIQNGYKNSFDDYLKSYKSRQVSNDMSKNEKTMEEDRIISKFTKLNKSKKMVKL